ncbi:hypothetical protein ACQI4L_09085 [Mycolicibacterium litorale]|uniref:hypothetical protein n=1 Tax=Mycolicibacterium litorale TaxID=758802 RepID=UPI003CEC40FC
MSEQVIRHRGARRDENGKFTPATDEPLTATVVAPGGGSEHVERSRTGETTAFTVYFIGGADVVNGDELTVRGQRFSIIVNDWRGSGRGGGLEVLCTRAQG